MVFCDKCWCVDDISTRILAKWHDALNQCTLHSDLLKQSSLKNMTSDWTKFHIYLYSDLNMSEHCTYQLFGWSSIIFLSHWICFLFSSTRTLIHASTHSFIHPSTNRPIERSVGNNKNKNNDKQNKIILATQKEMSASKNTKNNDIEN